MCELSVSCACIIRGKSLLGLDSARACRTRWGDAGAALSSAMSSAFLGKSDTPSSPPRSPHISLLKERAASEGLLAAQSELKVIDHLGDGGNAGVDLCIRTCGSILVCSPTSSVAIRLGDLPVMRGDPNPPNPLPVRAAVSSSFMYVVHSLGGDSAFRARDVSEL